MTVLRCLVVDDDPFSRAVVEHFVERHPSLVLAGSEENPVAGAARLDDGDIDLLFLDIEMDEMTGLELASAIADPPAIVLVSSKQEYAVEAFDLPVIDYLLKPISYARFLKAVNRVQGSGVRPGRQGPVFIKSEGRLVRLDLQQVRYVEAQGDYALIHADGKKHIVHGSMKSFETRLPAADFMRVHRSFIVRLDKIEDVSDSTLVIERAVVPIGASYRAALLERIQRL